VHSTDPAVARCADDVDASDAQASPSPHTDTDTAPEEAAKEAPVETAAQRLGVKSLVYTVWMISYWAMDKTRQHPIIFRPKQSEGLAWRERSPRQ